MLKLPSQLTTDAFLEQHRAYLHYASDLNSWQSYGLNSYPIKNGFLQSPSSALPPLGVVEQYNL